MIEGERGEREGEREGWIGELEREEEGMRRGRRG